jgi:hypothetical protein
MSATLRPGRVHRGQKRGGCDMHIFQTTRSAARALIDVEHPHAAQQLAHPRKKRGLQQLGGPGPDAAHKPGGDPHPEHRPHQVRSASHRQVMGAHQLRGAGQYPRPVLHSGQRTPRRGPTGAVPAPGAGPGDDLILGHPRRRRWRQVHDLTARHTHHRRPRQVLAAVPAAARITRHHLIRVLHQRHRRTRRTGLLTRPTPRRGTRGTPHQLAIRRVRRR